MDNQVPIDRPSANPDINEARKRVKKGTWQVDKVFQPGEPFQYQSGETDNKKYPNDIDIGDKNSV